VENRHLACCERGKTFTMNPITEFENQNRVDIQAMRADDDLRRLTQQWVARSCDYKYSYHFTWMGRPVIQYPQDLLAMQEIIWRIQPDLIIETGIAHGGSLIFYASLLELIGNDGMVLGIDREIRPHNRQALLAHPMSKRITMLEGSSTDPSIIQQVCQIAQGKSCILVALDSNHTHEHVLNELNAYAPFVTQGSYLVVFDTIVEDMPADFAADRPWGRGNNPKTAVHEFLRLCDRFEIDSDIESKLLITVAPDGYLQCVKA
jgi:cephalosporin hydroxylase